MRNAARTAGVFVACLTAGLIAATLGGQLLPDAPQPNQAVLDAIADKPFDVRVAAEWVQANRRPGTLLVWVVLPIAALAMGATAGALAARHWLLIGTAAVLSAWIWMNWGSTIDRETVELGALYLAVDSVAAWVVWSIRTRRRPDTHPGQRG